MSLTFDESRSFVVAKVTGELSGTEIAPFTEKLQEVVSHEGAKLAIDLSAVEMIDSSGLSALMNLVTRARLVGGQVVLVNPSPFVRNVLEITRLDQWFDGCDDLAQVEKGFASP